MRTDEEEMQTNTKRGGPITRIPSRPLWPAFLGRALRAAAHRADRAPSYSDGLRACAREKAADLRLPVGVHVRPDDGRPQFVRLGDHCTVRHDDPLVVQAHTIMAVLRIPIDIVYSEAVGERAAQPLAAREPVEPGFQRRTGVPATSRAGATILMPPMDGANSCKSSAPADANDPTSSVAMSTT